MEELNIEVSRLKAQVAELQTKVFGKPNSIKSPTMLTDLISKYDITASQASDVLYQIKSGDLKTSKDIEKYLDNQKRLIEQAKNNKNKGSDSN